MKNWIKSETKKVRILHFIRHGIYENPENTDKIGGVLNEQGKEQAKQLALEIAKIPLKAIHCSDLNRAFETAEFIAEHFPNLKLKQTKILRECIPTGLPEKKVSLKKRSDARKQLDDIVQRFFKPTNSIRHEAVVCHGNLIRALVCKTQGVRLTMWYQYFSYVFNCSVTRFAIYSDGRISLLNYNDISHLDDTCIT